MPEAEAVNRMFAGIARRYDLANRVISMGIDRGWRRRLVEMAARGGPKRVVDLATGSGDVAIALKKRLPGAEVTGLDFCEPMLEVARERLRKDGELPAGAIGFRVGDCLDLPLEEDSVEVLTIAFGLRNVTDKAAALRSMCDKVRFGGSVLVLEFSTVVLPLLKELYDSYSFRVIPRLGELVAGDRESYRYLVESIRMHPDQDALKKMMQDAGLSRVEYHNLTGGIVALHRGYKL